MKIKIGEDKVHQFRRSWDLRPDPLDRKNPYHPLNIETYKDIPVSDIPDSEVKQALNALIEYVIERKK